MSIQTDLDQAVACIKIDTQLLHDIVHGDDTTVVTTEGGQVKSSAKTVKDMEQAVQAVLDNLSITMGNLQTALHQSQDSANTAAEKAELATEQAQLAQERVSVVNLPNSLTGNQGRVLTVNETEDAYIFLPSTTICYGFRKSGAKLLVHIDEPENVAARLADYFIAPRGIEFEINTRGHLLLRF